MFIIFINSSFEGDASSGLSAAIINFMVRALQTLGDSSSIRNTISVIKSEGFHLFLRKTAHFVEFGILSILYKAGLGIFQSLRSFHFKRAFIALGLAIVYAITDEVHQLFVVGRVGTVIDVLIDTAGALVFIGIAGGIFIKRNKQVRV